MAKQLEIAALGNRLSSDLLYATTPTPQNWSEPQWPEGSREGGTTATAIWPSIRSTLEKRNEIPGANRNTNHGYYELVICARVREGEREKRLRERGEEWERVRVRGASESSGSFGAANTNGNGDQHLWAA